MTKRRAGQKVYNSRSWDRIRAMYMSSKNYICERCGRPATIYHHREHLTADNVTNPHVAYNADNLECLCHECHNAEHDRFNGRVVYNSKGDVVNVRPTAELQDFEDARAAIAQLDFDTPHL